jgi:hypothetical protein
LANRRLIKVVGTINLGADPLTKKPMAQIEVLLDTDDRVTLAFHSPVEHRTYRFSADQAKAVADHLIEGVEFLRQLKSS